MDAENRISISGRKGYKHLFVLTVALAVSLLSVSPLFAGGKKDAGGQTVIKLGGVGEELPIIWGPAVQALAKEGIKLELINFSDYSMPNRALADGEIDLNAFQHNAFLEAEIKNRGYALSPIANTITSVLGVYSEKIKNLEELKNGDTILIPNDSTNGGRALKTLEAAGVLRVDPSKGHLPTIKDITSNPRNIKIVEVDTSQILRMLPDVTAGVSTSVFILDAGKSPLDYAIYIKPLDKEADKPYINILVARTADKDNPLYQKVIKAFQTDETAKTFSDYYKGSALPAW